MTGLFFRALFACAAYAIFTVVRVHAGPVERLPQSSTTTIVTSSSFNAAATPQPKISKKPHLVAIGPTEVYVQPLAGPRVRRPPLLPVPKVVEPAPEVESATAPKTPADASQPVPAAPEPSAFSPDAAPTLLPVQKKTDPAPSSARPEEAPTENALTPAHDTEPELKDAVIYFETPVGPHGARATIPALVPMTSPGTATQPESRAIYRKEKE